MRKGCFLQLSEIDALSMMLSISGLLYFLKVTSLMRRRRTVWQLHATPMQLHATVAGVHAHRRFVSAVAFHPLFHHLLATGGDNTAKLWRLSLIDFSVTHVATLKGHRGSVNCVAFHPTAPLLATGSNDCTAKLWRLSSDNSSATCVATTEGHFSLGVASVAFHPTAHLLATGNLFTKTATLWR